MDGENDCMATQQSLSTAMRDSALLDGEWKCRSCGRFAGEHPPTFADVVAYKDVVIQRHNRRNRERATNPVAVVLIEPIHIVDLPQVIFNALLPCYRIPDQPRTHCHGFLTHRDAGQLYATCRYFRDTILEHRGLFLSLDCGIYEWQRGNDIFTVLSKIKGQIYSLVLSRTHTSIMLHYRMMRMLSNVHTLHFRDTESNFDNVDTLSKLHTLVIGSILSTPSINDVSMLGQLHTVRISNALHITDVSMLSTVRNLSLIRCDGITDLSAFANSAIEVLDLSMCWGITDVSMLGKIRELTLREMQIVDVSALGNVVMLDLQGCASITSVNALGKVPFLKLSYCRRLTDVTGLGKGNALLDLDMCTNLQHFSIDELGNIPMINLNRCALPMDIVKGIANNQLIFSATGYGFRANAKHFNKIRKFLAKDIDRLEWNFKHLFGEWKDNQEKLRDWWIQRHRTVG